MADTDILNTPLIWINKYLQAKAEALTNIQMIPFFPTNPTDFAAITQSFPESDGMHTDGTPRQRAGFARGSISPAHVCGIWSLRSPGSPSGSLAIAPALTWLLLIWLHHAIQRSLIDFGIELGF